MSAETLDPDRATFVVPAKGPTYYASWVAFGFFAVLAGLFLWAGGNPLVPLVGFGSFAALGAAGVLYFRIPRTFEADLRGVRVSHGRRVVKDIPWTEVKHVRYGVRSVAFGYAIRPSPFFTVTRKGAHLGIDFDMEDYPGRADIGSALARFGEEVAAIAARRGVPAERRDSMEPRRRRGRGRPE